MAWMVSRLEIYYYYHPWEDRTVGFPDLQILPFSCRPQLKG
jgi:hypothetical protein